MNARTTRDPLDSRRLGIREDPPEIDRRLLHPYAGTAAVRETAWSLRRWLPFGSKSDHRTSVLLGIVLALTLVGMILFR